jgi:hypothetical protein
MGQERPAKTIQKAGLRNIQNLQVELGEKEKALGSSSYDQKLNNLT